MNGHIALIDISDIFSQALIDTFFYSGWSGEHRKFDSYLSLISENDFIPDLILLSKEELKFIDKYTKHYSQAKIIFITEGNTEDDILEALSAGVHAFIPKGSEPKDYLSVIESTLSGKFPTSSITAKKIINYHNKRKTDSPALSLLSEREKEVLQCLSQGMFNKEIAEQLKISHETVRRHCFNIYKKMNVNNRSEAIRMLFTGE